MAVFEKQRSRQPRVDPRKIKGDGLWDHVQQLLASPRGMMRVGILLLLFFGTLAILHAPYEPLAYPKGSKVRENIFPRVAFKYVDEAATEANRAEARKNTPNVYERLPTQRLLLLAQFNGLLEQAAEAITPPAPPAEPPAEETTPPEEVPAEEPPAEPSPTSEPATPPDGATVETNDPPSDNGNADAKPNEKPTDYATLWGLADHFDGFKRLVADDEKLKAAQAAFLALMNYHDSLAILSRDRFKREEMFTQPSKICVATKDGSTTRHDLVDKANLLDPDSHSHREAYRIKLAARYDSLFSDVPLGPSVRDIILDHFVATLGANLRYSNELSERKKDEEARNVKPVVDSHTTGGEPLVAAGTTIGDKEASLLKAGHEAYLESITWWARAGSVLGSAILVGLLLTIIIAYTMQYQSKVIERVVRAFILVVLFLIVVIVAKFFSTQLQRSMLIFPLTTAAMVITVAYNRRFALVLSWSMVLLVTLVARFDNYSGTLLLLIGTSVAILQLGEIRSRSKPIRVGLVTGAVYFVTVWALELFWMHSPVWTETMQQSGIAFVAGFLPGFIILGGLPFIEHIFNVVTSIRLLELCDANQPALKKMAIDAPGTYSHSLLLGSIVEPAAETIGANGLLARVGAYFHDIGKVNKPQYFIENASQVPANGDHGRLKPQMSKIIITSHIKDGLDMARQYGLPRAINVFIAEHHGTTVIEYFFNEAKKATQDPVDDTEYRYPGPKPQSRETAILMLADSCEGAVRSIKDHTAPKIEDKVHEIVMKRLLDGQLNASDMTLNDVRAVEQSICKSLISVHHGRIAYPDAEAKADTSPGDPLPRPNTAPTSEEPPKSDA
jgi:cyclic-di-AMP phosphodiesterase PgpH